MYKNKLAVFLVFSVALKGARYDFIFNYFFYKMVYLCILNN